MFPVLEEVAESADGVELFVNNSSGGLFEGAGEEVEGMEDSIFVRDGWMRKLFVVESNSVGDEEGSGGGVDDLESAVVFQGGADVEAVTGAEGPGGSGGGLVVDEDAAANGAEGGGVEVEGDIEVLPYRREGGNGGFAEEVERELGLREELFPQVVGEGGRYTGKDAEQVGFEGADGTFGDVAAVDIGGARVGMWPAICQ